MGDVCFNGKWASDYGIVVQKHPSRPMTVRKYSSTAVSGRAGNILLPEGYFENVMQEYDYFVKASFSETVTDGAANRVAEWLFASNPFNGADADGYFWVEDTYSPTVKRRGIVSDVSEIKNHRNRFGQGTFTFEEKPFKYAKNGLEWTEANDKWIYIDSPFYAKPLFRMVLDWGSDNSEYKSGSVNVSHYNLGVPSIRVVCYDPPLVNERDDQYATIYIDSETCEIYALIDGIKVNYAPMCYVEIAETGAASVDFPYLLPNRQYNLIGVNNCSVEIMRRDYTL